MFTPDGVRVPKFKTKRLLLRIESVAKISQRVPGKGSNSEPGNTLSEATPLT